MTTKEFIEKIQERIAETSVGASTVRNQGPSGIANICRSHLKEIDAKEFFTILNRAEEDITGFINTQTKGLQIKLDKHVKAKSKESKAGKKRKIPHRDELWGIARKVVNIYLRGLIYNAYLSERYGLPLELSTNTKLIQRLEVPLDSHVAEGLKRQSLKNGLPKLTKWKSIQALTPQQSDEYQERAATIASIEKIARVHLDLIFWRQLTKEQE